MKKFFYKTTIKMHDTDAAGLLFFGNQFKIAHDAYEAFFLSIGIDFRYLVKDASFFVPIVHAEADYKAPLFVGDKIIVKVQLGQVGRTSFSLEYFLQDEKGKNVGSVKTVHVSISKKTRRPIPLPSSLLNAFKKAT